MTAVVSTTGFGDLRAAIDRRDLFGELRALACAGPATADKFDALVARWSARDWRSFCEEGRHWAQRAISSWDSGHELACDEERGRAGVWLRSRGALDAKGGGALYLASLFDMCKEMWWRPGSNRQQFALAGEAPCLDLAEALRVLSRADGPMLCVQFDEEYPLDFGFEYVDDERNLNRLYRPHVLRIQRASGGWLLEPERDFVLEQLAIHPSV